MLKFALLMILPWLILFLAVMGQRCWWLATDPDYYGWPAVTKCRICDDTVWCWQEYSRRPIPVALDNEHGLTVSCSMSGLMHNKCTGMPKPVDVKVSTH